MTASEIQSQTDHSFKYLGSIQINLVKMLLHRAQIKADAQSLTTMLNTRGYEQYCLAQISNHVALQTTQ